ncbi:MAG: EBNA-1 nuclear protein [Magnetovibrio sp.]|nr:EBNA-1 nuclear protein [Magnetovibrio sp.]|tara:strand:+ start:1898 stop:2896 length:999 start_codon:yes stop_codon:yes gene_type:complete
MAVIPPYLMFLGDAADQLAAKTAAGVVHWRPELCVGQLRLRGCNADLGIPDMSIEEAVAKGVKTLIVGVANRGGVMSQTWIDVLVDALEHGLDIASGLHSRLIEVPMIEETAAKYGRHLTDVRHPTRTFSVGSGKKRSGKRLIPVGTDCSIGKMYTALALEQEMSAQGIKATFRATGQTGIFIAGDGVSVDAVISDFISGAVEWLAPDNDPDHWDLIEGQGSLFHASYAGVSLGLLHGAQADALVLCHEPTRSHMRGLPDYPIPGIAECIAANEKAARLTNPSAKCIGIAINTHALSKEEANDYMLSLEKEFALPVVDPVKTGVGRLLENLP